MNMYTSKVMRLIPQQMVWWLSSRICSISSRWTMAKSSLKAWIRCTDGLTKTNISISRKCTPRVRVLSFIWIRLSNKWKVDRSTLKYFLKLSSNSLFSKFFKMKNCLVLHKSWDGIVSAYLIVWTNFFYLFNPISCPKVILFPGQSPYSKLSLSIPSIFKHSKQFLNKLNKKCKK